MTECSSCGWVHNECVGLKKRVHGNFYCHQCKEKTGSSGNENLREAIDIRAEAEKGHVEAGNVDNYAGTPKN